jgi:hypothetical protein
MEPNEFESGLGLRVEDSLASPSHQSHRASTDVEGPSPVNPTISGSFTVFERSHAGYWNESTSIPTPSEALQQRNDPSFEDSSTSHPDLSLKYATDAHKTVREDIFQPSKPGASNEGLAAAVEGLSVGGHESYRMGPGETPFDTHGPESLGSNRPVVSGQAMDIAALGTDAQSSGTPWEGMNIPTLDDGAPPSGRRGSSAAEEIHDRTENVGIPHGQLAEAELDQRSGFGGQAQPTEDRLQKGNATLQADSGVISAYWPGEASRQHQPKGLLDDFPAPAAGTNEMSSDATTFPAAGQGERRKGALPGFMSEENKLLEQQIVELEAQLEATDLELENTQERSKMMGDHLANVKVELKYTHSQLVAKQKEIDTEVHLQKLSSHEKVGTVYINSGCGLGFRTREYRYKIVMIRAPDEGGTLGERQGEGQVHAQPTRRQTEGDRYGSSLAEAEQPRKGGHC